MPDVLHFEFWAAVKGRKVCVGTARSGPALCWIALCSQSEKTVEQLTEEGWRVTMFNASEHSFEGEGE